jgi:hypothetical protein
MVYFAFNMYISCFQCSYVVLKEFKVYSLHKIPRRILHFSDGIIEADDLFPASTEVRNAWSYTSRMVLKHRDNFTFFI